MPISIWVVLVLRFLNNLFDSLRGNVLQEVLLLLRWLVVSKLALIDEANVILATILRQIVVVILIIDHLGAWAPVGGKAASCARLLPFYQW